MHKRGNVALPFPNHVVPPEPRRQAPFTRNVYQLFFLTVEFRKTGKSERIGGWQSEAYEFTTGSGDDAVDMVVWISDEIPVNESQRAYMESVTTPETAWMLAIYDLGGFPVRQDFQMGSMQMWAELQSIEKKPAPAGTYEIPAGTPDANSLNVTGVSRFTGIHPCGKGMEVAGEVRPQLLGIPGREVDSPPRGESQMTKLKSLRKYLFVLACLCLFQPALVAAQWAAQPGETVRNAFGSSKGESAAMCRGACGAGCPSACRKQTTYECLDSDRMLRVTTYICSTHQGCRDHDDCLDRCAQNRAQGFDCDAYCHSDAVNAYGLQNAASWAVGGGPFDNAPITFEYTRDTPNGLEPAFRCSESAQLQCNGGKGQCVADGSTVEPVFDSYPAAGPEAMRVANFRSGPLCGDSVCQQATLIRVTGQDTCENRPCTKYGVEFDYENAEPGVPLLCSGEVTGGGDFVGNILKKGADMMPQMGDGSGEDGMAALVGMMQQVLKSADTPEDVRISMAPLDEDGNPIESQRVGSTHTGSASVPRSVDIPAASGRMVVPMYQLVDTQDKNTRVRQIRCSHKGLPVLEVAFQLQF